MGEYIERETAIKRVCEILAYFVSSDIRFGLELAIQAIKETPHIVVVEMVRCNGCEYWQKQSDSLQGRCALTKNYPTGDWFCANGKRKNEK